jgi:hypothetical protein
MFISDKKLADSLAAYIPELRVNGEALLNNVLEKQKPEELVVRALHRLLDERRVSVRVFGREVLTLDFPRCGAKGEE